MVEVEIFNAINLRHGIESKCGDINRSVYSSSCHEEQRGGGETSEGHTGGECEM